VKLEINRPVFTNCTWSYNRARWRMIVWLTDWFVCLFVRSFVHTLIHSFIHLLTYLFFSTIAVVCCCRCRVDSDTEADRWRHDLTGVSNIFTIIIVVVVFHVLFSCRQQRGQVVRPSRGSTRQRFIAPPGARRASHDTQLCADSTSTNGCTERSVCLYYRIVYSFRVNSHHWPAVC